MLPYGRLFAASDVANFNDLEAVTGDRKEIILKAADVKDFAARLRGDLLLRESAGYDVARRVWNASFDRYPALIARCTRRGRCHEAVNFAAAHQLLLSVRGGGHSLSGQSSCDKGLVIDLSQMNGVRVDPARRIATVEGGALLGALDRESLALGLATTAGTVSHTGVGGLTLGGGFGRLCRRFGLACDNVRAIDLVTADGKFLTASNQQNQDLFWGLRGGGGNFGVATSFEFQLHPVDPDHAGRRSHVLRSRTRPPSSSSSSTSPPRRPMSSMPTSPWCAQPDDKRFVHIDVCYSGSHADGEKVIAPLRQIRKPTATASRRSHT